MCPLHPRYNYTKSLNYCTFYACLAAQSKGLTAPAAQKPRMFSTSEDVSQPTESTQQHSASAPSLGGDYMSIARDGLSEKHRASSLNSPIHGKYINSSSNALLFCFTLAAQPIAFPHMLQWNSPCDIRALDEMSSPIDAAVHDDTAYFRPYRSRKIYLYNLTRGWSISADCLVRDTSLVMLPVAYEGAVRFHLHTIGGVKRKIHRQNENEEEFTDAIYQLTDPAHREWISSIYPKLKTNRSQVTVVLNNDCLIIAGGKSTDGPVNTVDVLTLTCREWREVACIPYPVYRASGCVCNGMLYILGGYVSPFDPVRSACVATVSQLVESHSNDQGIFNTIKDLEFNDSACVSFRNHILAIGGWKKLGAALTDQPKGTKLVHVYDTSRKIWKELKGQLSEPRCFAFAAAFEDKQQIMTVGGYNIPDGACTDSVEFAIIN